MVNLNDNRQTRALAEWLTMVDGDNTASVAQMNNGTLSCTEASDAGFGHKPHYYTTYIAPDGECYG